MEVYKKMNIMAVVSYLVFILHFLQSCGTIIQPNVTWTNNYLLKLENTIITIDDGSCQVRIITSNADLSSNTDPSYDTTTVFQFCGFYCNFLNCSSFFFAIVVANYFGTGYIENPQVVWCANRDHPVGENATLVFSPDGNLLLRDSDGTLVWSTNTQGMSVAELRLSSPGRLQLFDSHNVSVWDSFSYPTDTWLLGQSLNIGQQLSSSTSDTDFSTGLFYLSVFPDRLKAYIKSNPPQRYFPDDSWIPGDPVAGNITFINGTLISSSSLYQFMRLESNGHLKHYTLTENGLSMLEDVFASTVCEYPTVCGAYGICSKYQCICPNRIYFNPVDARQPELGCSLVTPISCESSDYHSLIPLDDVTYFNYKDFNAAVVGITNKEQCKQACLKTCSCKAALFNVRNVTDGSQFNYEGHCYLPSQLYSMQNYEGNIERDASFVYIKVQLEKSRKTLEKSQKTHKKNRVLLGSALASALVGLLLIALVMLRIKRRFSTEMDNEDGLEEAYGLPSRFSFEELKIVTNNFSKKLGQGGFGSVFEGLMDGKLVAVKRLDNFGQGTKEFLAEVLTIGNVHHIHLVRLVGFCSEKAYRLLVYEYMSNGSLEKWIFNKYDNVVLEWKTRVQIITEVAKALAYLHEECRQRIIHLDIKPQNILLDEAFHAKVSDFGLSKLIDREQSHVLTKMRGTRGYLAPEWLTSKITEKADVYSFGVVMLEVVCGRPNLDYSQNEECLHLISVLQDRVRECRLADILDNDNGDTQLYKEEMVKMIKLAIWCLQHDYAKRPSMTTVVKVLDGSAELQTNVDINFTVTTPSVNAQFSDAPSASRLSEGR